MKAVLLNIRVIAIMETPILEHFQDCVFIDVSQTQVDQIALLNLAYYDGLNFYDGMTEAESQTLEATKILAQETQKYIKRTQDGQSAYAKISAEFRLAKLSGQISEEAHSFIENILIPVRNEVLAGQWISGRNVLEAIGSVQIGVELYDRLHLQLSEYINNNY